jgi:hypothetical protein
MLINPVAVEKLASEKSAKIKTRQEAPQTIFPGRLDIFYLPISTDFEKKGLSQQPRLLSTVTLELRGFLPSPEAIRRFAYD